MKIKKILLCAINSRYLHTNLAVRSIFHYVKMHTAPLVSGKDYELVMREWNISQPIQDIIRGIVEEKADVVLFSVYVWNVELISKIIPVVRLLLPQCVLAAGGPEVSYNASTYLAQYPALDFIVSGEGEETLCELTCALCAKKSLIDELPLIHGIWCRTKMGVVFSGERELLENLALIPFPYGDETDTIDPAHHIVYYESSRGCPFTCAYCLSSRETGVRFLSLERVYSDMAFFLKGSYKLVKFVDRTFNIRRERYLAIWEYIIDHYNGVTTFHFEISAHDLSSSSYALLEKAPRGAIQFEIGIQSINAETLRLCGRKNDLAIMRSTITRIPSHVHTHLDLIAALPEETFESFRDAFNFTATLYPNMLQLGFLKILHGTAMETIAHEKNFVYMSSPPYEVLATPTLSYDEVCVLKDVEWVLDVYYNSHICEHTMKYIIEHYNAFDFFYDFSRYLQKKQLLHTAHKIKDYMGYLLSYVLCQMSGDVYAYELVRFDFVLGGKMGAFPAWYERRYSKEAHNKALRTHTKVTCSRESYAHSEYEQFTFNPLTGEQKETALLILYDVGTCIVLEDRNDETVVITS